MDNTVAGFVRCVYPTYGMESRVVRIPRWMVDCYVPAPPPGARAIEETSEKLWIT